MVIHIKANDKKERKKKREEASPSIFFKSFYFETKKKLLASYPEPEEQAGSTKSQYDPTTESDD